MQPLLRKRELWPTSRVPARTAESVCSHVGHLTLDCWLWPQKPLIDLPACAWYLLCGPHPREPRHHTVNPGSRVPPPPGLALSHAWPCLYAVHKQGDFTACFPGTALSRCSPRHCRALGGGHAHCSSAICSAEQHITDLQTRGFHLLLTHSRITSTYGLPGKDRLNTRAYLDPISITPGKRTVKEFLKEKKKAREYKMMQPLWKTEWQFIKKIKCRISIRSSNSGYVHKRIESRDMNDICTPIFIAACSQYQEVEAAQVSMNTMEHYLSSKRKEV